MVKERKQKDRKLIEKVKDDPQGGGFARALGSTDFYTRERGLQALTLWLTGHKNVKENDVLRLWKALFYCFWHSDKVPVQTALAERLSEIMSQVPEAVGRLYFKVFVRTIRREWFGIDRHRMDKFMMLIRKFYAQHLRFLQSTGWDADVVAEFGHFWRDEVLLPSDTVAAAGFAYHVADLVLPELTRVVGESGKVPSDTTIVGLFSPFCAAAEKTRDGVMVRRLFSGLFEPIAHELRQPETAHALKNLNAEAFAEYLFDLGAKQETRATNREALYAASKDIEEAAKHRGKPKKNKKQEQKETGSAVDVQEPSGAHSAGKKANKKRKTAEGGAEEATAAAKVESSAAAADEVPKAKKSKAANGVVTVAAPVAEKPSKKNKLLEGRPPADKQTPISDKKKKPKDKKVAALTAAAAEAIEESVPGQDDGTPVASPTKAATEMKRKNVRFSLKRNLVMTIGQPPLPEDIRTPPTSKPKGSALKQNSTVERPARSNLGKKLDRERMPASAPSKIGGKRGSRTPGTQKPHRSPVGTRSAAKSNSNAPRTLPSPESVRRPRAAEFF